MAQFTLMASRRRTLSKISLLLLATGLPIHLAFIMILDIHPGKLIVLQLPPSLAPSITRQLDSTIPLPPSLTPSMTRQLDSIIPLLLAPSMTRQLDSMIPLPPSLAPSMTHQLGSTIPIQDG